MNENATKGRMSEIVEAEQTIKVLSSELIKFREIAAKWQIDFNVELVKTDAGYAVQIQAKTGERGVVQTVTAQDVVYFEDDHSTIANDLAIRLLVQVLGDVAKEELVPQLTKAFANVKSLSKSAL